MYTLSAVSSSIHYDLKTVLGEEADSPRGGAGGSATGPDVKLRTLCHLTDVACPPVRLMSWARWKKREAEEGPRDQIFTSH